GPKDETHQQEHGVGCPMCGYGVRAWTTWTWAVSVSLVLMCAGRMTVSAQVQYARGQNVAPVFEGWEHNPDGTYSMVFGYLNRNFEEEVDIPLGPGNTIT